MQLMWNMSRQACTLSNATGVCVLIGICLDRLVHCLIVTSTDKDGYVHCKKYNVCSTLFLLTHHRCVNTLLNIGVFSTLVKTCYKTN